MSAVRRMAKQNPLWNLVYAIPNDCMVSQSARNRAVRLGLLRGAADIAVDLPSWDCCKGYLRIEFKTHRGEQSLAQRNYQNLVENYGRGSYAICRSAEEGLETVCRHLGLESSTAIGAALPRRAHKKENTPINAFQCI